MGRLRQTCETSEMNAMIRAGWGLALVLAIGVDGRAADAGATRKNAGPTPDGRFNTACHPWGNDQTRELCAVSFYRLIAAPERYDGKLVAVNGYLKSVFGRVVLFPSESSFNASSLSEGIEVINYTLPKALEPELDDGIFPVMVVAVFDAKYIGSGAWPLLGAFRDVKNVDKVLTLPAGP